MTTKIDSNQLKDTGVVAAIYGNATHVPQVTVNAEGQVVEATEIEITAATPLTVKEIDGSPTVPDVTVIRLNNGSVTDDGGGQVTLDVGGGSITVKEIDGSPTVPAVTTIRVSNGTLSNDGSGQVTITTGNGSITVKEIDGTPTVAGVRTIRVTNGKMTNDGSGQVTLDLTGSPITVQDESGGVVVTDVNTIKFPDGAVFDDTGGVVGVITGIASLSIGEDGSAIGDASVGINFQSGGGITVGGSDTMSGTPNVKITQAGNVVALTATYTVLANDSKLLIDTSGGIFTATLPSFASGIIIGQQFTFKKISADANVFTLAVNGADGELIDDASTLTIVTQWESITVFTDLVNWYVI